ncbi:MAG: glycoside hydrolase family 25 protein [Anaerolineae bacterium]
MSNPYELKLPTVVDLYQEEAPVDWAGMAPKPYRALLQCTKGQYHRDEQCANFIQQCNELGIKYGLYHFLFPNNIDEQVEIYTETVEALGGLGHSPPVVDVEYAPPPQKPHHPDNMPRGGQWAVQIKQWLDAVELWCNQKPVIYTSRNFWSFTCGAAGAPPEWASEYPLWVAWYPKPKKRIAGLDRPTPQYMPVGWQDFALWQYSESGRTDGHLANDLSIISADFMGMLDEQFPPE